MSRIEAEIRTNPLETTFTAKETMAPACLDIRIIASKCVSRGKMLLVLILTILFIHVRLPL